MITQAQKAWAKKVLEQCEKKYTWVAEKNQDGIPYTTMPDGSYDNRADETKFPGSADGLSWWTNGFWGGILWRLFVSTKNERIAEIANVSECQMDRAFENFYGLHHDVGFMWLPTSVAHYRLTGDEASRRRALHAASILLSRFNPAGNFLRAWNDDNAGENVDTRGWAIIDCMLNIPLLYWASRELNDPRFQNVAMLHADTVMKNFIREDGSSNHIVEFDPIKGHKVATHGGQGYENGSAWSRGQGWALYGFVVSYQQTQKKEYLETAQKIARYCIDHLPENAVVPCDFCQPAASTLQDSSAAAIIACGLLDLAKHCDAAQADEYQTIAVKILQNLDSTCADYTEQCDAILKHCCVAYHFMDQQDIQMSYADYFYIAALHKINPIEQENAFYW